MAESIFPVSEGLTQENIREIIGQFGAVETFEQLGENFDGSPGGLLWPLRRSANRGTNKRSMQFFTRHFVEGDERVGIHRGVDERDMHIDRPLYLVELAAFTIAAVRDLTDYPVTAELRTYTEAHLAQHIETAQLVVAHFKQLIAS